MINLPSNWSVTSRLQEGRRRKLFWQGAQGVGPYIGTHLFNIMVSGGTYTNTFWFNFFFNNQVDNLIAMPGESVSAACFHFDGAVNADVFNNLSATCGAPYGFYMQNTQETSGSEGDVFNTLNAEGGCPGQGTDATCAGLYVGNGYQAITFNGVYTENVLHPIVLGENPGTESCVSITFNSPTISGPSTASANQLALVDIDNCSNVTFVSPYFNIYGIGNAAPLTFSGGGCTTEPHGLAIPNPSGIIKAVTLTWPGAGCTTAPTVSIGGAGTGAHITASEAGGVVTGLTISAGGTGYSLSGIVPIVYNATGGGATIINPLCPDGRNGLGSPCWAWIVRADGGVASPVRIDGGAITDPSYGSIPADLRFTGYYDDYYVTYLDSLGTTHQLSVQPQAYP